MNAAMHKHRTAHRFRKSARARRLIVPLRCIGNYIKDGVRLPIFADVDTPPRCIGHYMKDGVRLPIFEDVD